MAGQIIDVPGQGQVEFPEGMSDADIVAAIKKTSAPKMAINPPLALTETAANLGTGMLGAAVGGLAGLAQGAKNLVSPGMPAGDRVQQVQEALTYQPRTVLGQKLSSAVAYPFEKLAEGADWVGGKAADATGSPAVGAAVNTALQAAPMALPLAKGPVGRMVGREQAALDTKQALAAPRDAAIERYREAGLVLPPAEANPTIINQVLEGFSGQAKVQKLASTKNQPILNQIVRKGLGIAPDVPIDIPTLQTVRKQAGEPFERARNLGEITTTPEYSAALDKVAEKYVGAAKSFPEEASAVEKAVDSARVAKFDSSAAIDKIKIERARADKAFRTGDTELGKAHKAIAGAIEGQIETHLAATGGDTGLLADIRKGREIIAKSYDVQKALKGNDVDVRVLAAQLKKGSPMSGDIRTAAEFGRDFKKAAQTLENSGHPVPSIFDAAGGSLTGLMAHLSGGVGLGPAALLGVGGAASRPLIRSGILTQPYQNAMAGAPSYALGNTTSLMDILTRSQMPGLLLSGETAKQ